MRPEKNYDVPYYSNHSNNNFPISHLLYIILNHFALITNLKLRIIIYFNIYSQMTLKQIGGSGSVVCWNFWFIKSFFFNVYFQKSSLFYQLLLKTNVWYFTALIIAEILIYIYKCYFYFWPNFPKRLKYPFNLLFYFSLSSALSNKKCGHWNHFTHCSDHCGINQKLFWLVELLFYLSSHFF